METGAQNNGTLNFAERMARVTPRKDPGTVLTNIAEKETEKILDRVSSAWSWKDNEPLEKKTIEPENDDDEDEDDEKDYSEVKLKEKSPDNNTEKKVYTDQDFEDSAQTMTELLNQLTSTGFSLWERMKLKRAFTREQWAQIKQIQSADESTLDDEKKALKQKALRLMEKFRARRKEIEMSDDEIRRCDRGFKNYYKTSNKTVSPEVIFYSTIGTFLMGRFSDSFFDDDYI